MPLSTAPHSTAGRPCTASVPAARGDAARPALRPPRGQRRAGVHVGARRRHRGCDVRLRLGACAPGRRRALALCESGNRATYCGRGPVRGGGVAPGLPMDLLAVAAPAAVLPSLFTSRCPFQPHPPRPLGCRIYLTRPPIWCTPPRSSLGPPPFP